MKVKITENQLNNLSSQNNISYDIATIGPKSTTFKFFIDGNQVGFLSFSTRTHPKYNEKIANVESSSITGPRNQGYGLLMYQTFINYLKEQNYDIATSDNTIQHDAIHKIWEKLGAKWSDGYYVLQL